MKIQGKAPKRLLLMLTVLLGIAGLVGGAFGYRRVKLHRDREAWKTEGIAASRAGDHARAVELLTRYLHARADDIDALRAYAESRQAASDLNDPQAAIDTMAVLKSLSQLTSLHENEQHRLLELYARSGNDALAVREADLLLAGHPGDAEALHYKACALLRQGDFASARETARRWGQAAPNDLDAQCVELAAMRQSGATPRDIISLAATFRRADPDEPRFELLESIALTLTNQDVEPADLAPPGTPPERRTAADWARQSAAHVPAGASWTGTLVEQLNRLALFEDSLSVLQSSAGSGDAQSRRTLARRLWESAQWEPLAQLLKDEPKAASKTDTELLYLDGVALTRLNQLPQAAQIEAELSARGNDPLANAWLQLLKRYSGVALPEPRQQAECFEHALERDLNNPYLQYFCAEALERLGETDLAIQHLETANSLSATWAAPPARLAEMLLARGRVDAALRAADQGMKREFRNGQIHDLSVAVILCRVWLAALTSGRSTDASGLSQLIAAVQKASPGENETGAIHVELLVWEKDRAAASKMLSEIIQSPRPMSETTLLRYGALSQSAGLGLEAACWDRCQREHGMTPDLTYARAGAAMAAGGPAKGLELFNAEYARHDAAKELVWQVARAHFLDAAADPGAAAAWIALGDAHPDALGIQQMTLAAPAARSDRQFIDRTIERVRKLAGEGGVQWRLARARWLLEAPGASRNDVEAATRLLGAIVRTCPQCPDARLELASSLQKLQQTDSAVEQLQAAAALLPDSLDVALRTIALLDERGDFAKAEQLLRRFTDGPLASPKALVAMGWVQEQQGNFDGAAQSYRHALTLRPDFVMAQNNLAMVLVRRGGETDLKEALALAVQVAKSYPNSASALDTLAAAQAGNKDYESALTSIGRAIALDGTHQAFKVRQIELLVETGRRDTARDLLAQLQSAPLNSSQTTKDWDFTNRLRRLRQNLATTATSTSAK